MEASEHPLAVPQPQKETSMSNHPLEGSSMTVPPATKSPTLELLERVKDPAPATQEEEESALRGLWRLIRSEAAVHSIEEARFLMSTRGGFSNAQDLIGRQLDTITNRSSNILSLVAVVLTITGFSGPKMAQTSVLAKVMMGMGLCFCTLAASVVMVGSFQVRWATQIACWARNKAVKSGERDGNYLEVMSLAETIRYRNRKHLMFNIELTMLIIGLVGYLGAFLLFLIDQPTSNSS